MREIIFNKRNPISKKKDKFLIKIFGLEKRGSDNLIK